MSTVLEAEAGLSAPDEGPGPVRRRLRLALVAAVVAALGWLVLFSPLLAVERVVVTGAERVTPDEVRAVALVPLGRPLARVDIGAVRARVAEIDPVARVEVVRAWPSTVRVQVVERAPAVGFLTAGRYVLIDPDGVPFARVPRLPEGTPRLQVARPGADDPATRAALAVVRGLPASLRDRVGIVRATAPDAVTLLLRDGRQVVWGDAERGEDKARATEALLRLPGSRYDVSSPEVVVRAQPVSGGTGVAGTGSG